MTNKEIFLPILVVEDEEDHARLIKKAINQDAKILNDVFHVENGREVIDFLRKTGQFKGSVHSKPGLILLDVKMPMMNGFEVLAEIKADPFLKMIPVVMLTTSSTTEDIKNALSLGANDYIVKPIKYSDFNNKVAKIGYYWGLISDSQKNIN